MSVITLLNGFWSKQETARFLTNARHAHGFSCGRSARQMSFSSSSSTPFIRAWVASAIFRKAFGSARDAYQSPAPDADLLYGIVIAVVWGGEDLESESLFKSDVVVDHVPAPGAWCDDTPHAVFLPNMEFVAAASVGPFESPTNGVHGVLFEGVHVRPCRRRVIPLIGFSESAEK